MEILRAIKAALPDANDRQPGEVLSFVLEAVRAHSAKTIEGRLTTVTLLVSIVTVWSIYGLKPQQTRCLSSSPQRAVNVTVGRDWAGLYGELEKTGL